MQKRLVSIDEHLTQDVYGTDGTTIAQTLWYHESARGDTVAMTDAAGNVVLRLAYSAYGQAYKITATGALEDLSAEESEQLFYGFQGRQIDLETGLIHFRQRMYSPEQGRFISRDPLGYVDGLGLHEFVGGNPGNRWDPWGESIPVYPHSFELTVDPDYYKKIEAAGGAGKIVAEAFQKIVGKDIGRVWAEPQYKTQNGERILTHWEIKAEDNPLNTKKHPKEVVNAWKRLKKAIKSERKAGVVLTDVYQGEYLRDCEAGGAKYADNAYVDYSFFALEYYVYGLDDSKYENYGALMPFEIVLWHEFMGHIHGEEDGGHTWGKADPVHAIENEARTAWNYNNPKETLELRSKKRYSETPHLEPRK